MSTKKQKGSGKEVVKREKPLIKEFRMKGTIFFLTYKGCSESGVRINKQMLAWHLLENNRHDRSAVPTKYMIVEQMYDDGEPHFHVILVYPKRKPINNPAHYDFKGIHPNIQQMRNMKAALMYLQKQDPRPLTNMDIIAQKRAARAKDSSSLYQLLQQQMHKDPFDFDVKLYCQAHGLFKQIYKANYSKALNLLRMAQQAKCTAILRTMSGIRLITRQLIEAALTPEQLTQYDSWTGYQTIIKHINQVHNYPNRNASTQLPGKTRHLYLCGRSDIGKSALITHRPSELHPRPGLSAYYSTYHLSLGQKYFPPYSTHMCALVSWQQFVINSSMFPKSRYNQLLVYLEGDQTRLPIKGRQSVMRKDNPKHFLTSNRTLKQHVERTFNSPQGRYMALMNITARLQQVNVPDGKSLHFLRKLFHPL